MRKNRFTEAMLAAFIVAGVSMGLCATAVTGQTAPATGAAPTGPTLQAEFLKTIDASQARVGDEVTAKTVMPLEFGGVKFPPGATVIGHVAQAEPSRLVLVFEQIIVKKNAPIGVGLSLRAIMMPQSYPRGIKYLRARPAEAEGLPLTPGSQTLGAEGTFYAVRKGPRKILPSLYSQMQVPSQQAMGALLG
jgi:hypothetical protein